MSKITVTTIPNPLFPTMRGVEKIAPCVLGDLIERKFPNGSRGTLTVILNGRTLDPINEKIQLAAEDHVLLIRTPGTGFEILPFIYAALVSMAINLVVSMIFKPKKPTALVDQPAASPVYSITGSQNAARLGEPIPVGYGEFIQVPDFGSQPYVEFVNHEQFLQELLVIGQGDYEISEMMVGESAVTNFSEGVVNWRTWKSSQHLQMEGTIEDAGLAGVFYENVVTSPEVGDQELTSGIPTLVNPPKYWKAISTEYILPSGDAPHFGLTPGATVYGPYSDWLYEHPDEVVDTIYSYSYGFAGLPYPAGDPTTHLAWMDVKSTLFEAGPYPFGSVVPPGTIETPDPGDSAVGWFESCKPGQIGDLIMVDFVFPGGLYTANASTGAFEAAAIQINVDYQEINLSGAPISAIVIVPFIYTEATNNVRRYTEKIPVDLGRYRVRCSRVTANAANLKTQDKVVWTGMKFKLGRRTFIPATGEPHTLLLHANGADASTDVFDTSLNEASMTVAGNAQIDTAESVFGGASLAFDGTGDHVTTPVDEIYDIGTLSAASNHTWRFRARFAPVSSTPASAEAASILAAMKSWWPLDENAGTPTYNDAHGSNHLTVRNAAGNVNTSAVSSATAKYGRSFFANHTDDLAAYIPRSNTNLDMVDSDFSFGGWFRSNFDASTAAFLMGRVGGTTLNCQAALVIENDGTLRFWLFHTDGTNFANRIQVNSGMGGGSPSTWFFLVGVYDKTNNAIRIKHYEHSTTGLTTVSQSLGGNSIVTGSNNSNFCISEGLTSDSGFFSSNRGGVVNAEECFFVNKALTDAEVLYMVGAGGTAGVSYSMLTADAAPSAGPLPREVLMAHAAPGAAVGSGGGGYALVTDDAGKLGIEVGGPSSGLAVYQTTAVEVTDSTWYALAFVIEAGVPHIYVDGAEVAGTVTTGTFIGMATTRIDYPLRLGANATGGDEFAGHMDEISVMIGVASYTANYTPEAAEFPDPVPATGDDTLSDPTVYGDTMLVAVKIKATNGIASAATSRIRFRCTRILPILGDGAEIPTSSPADAFVDIYTADYGGARPLAEVDMPALAACRDLWAAYGHTGFNAVFAQKSTVFEALTMASQVVAASPLPVGQKISVQVDSVKSTRIAMFNEANLSGLVVGYEFDKDGEPPGVRVEYRRPDSFTPDFVVRPEAETDLESFTLFGCNDEEIAEQYATLLLNRKSMLRKTIAFDTELEGLILLPGDRIGVQHSMPRWGQVAIVEEVSGSLLTLDRELDWSIPGPHACYLSNEINGVSESILCEQGAAANELNLLGDPDFGLFGRDAHQEPTRVAFGTLDTILRDWIVQTVTPNGQVGVHVEGITYNPAVYIGAMPHQLSEGTPGAPVDTWIIAGTPGGPSGDDVIAGGPLTSYPDEVDPGTPGSPSAEI
jgi:hypothetical protein